jgi:hypothetical protein
VTFNGAGIGAIDIRSYLKNLVDTFSTLAANADGQAFAFEDGALAALYGRARLAYQSGASISAADRAILYRLARSPADSGRSGKAIATKSIAACARSAWARGRFNAQNLVYGVFRPMRPKNTLCKTSMRAQKAARGQAA